MTTKKLTIKSKRWIRRLILAAMVVLLPQLFFQLHVVEGPSMWPAFNDGVEREWILSLRNWADRAPEVYDILVVEDPENPAKRVVKRVVALPGDHPNILDGDVRVRSLGLDKEWFLLRNLDQILSTRAPILRLNDLRQKSKGIALEIVNDRHRCLVPLKGACSISNEGAFLKLESQESESVVRLPELNFMDDHKSQTNRITVGDNIVHDIIVTFGIYNLSTLAEGLEFEIQHWTAPDAIPSASLLLKIEADGLVLRCTSGEDSPFEVSIPKQDEMVFRLVLVDDVQALMLRTGDGEEQFEVLDKRRRGPIYRPKESYLKLLSRSGSVILSQLDIDRDIHYTSPTDGAKPQAVARALSDSQVDSGKYFLLGDNSPESRDSRHWRVTEPYQVVGRPILVVWPWSRIRVLP
ncbi:MAG: signal peptidase I [Planctomycetota bacterium]|jgi:signal peptidase I